MKILFQEMAIRHYQLHCKVQITYKWEFNEIQIKNIHDSDYTLTEKSQTFVLNKNASVPKFIQNIK